MEAVELSHYILVFSKKLTSNFKFQCYTETLGDAAGNEGKQIVRERGIKVGERMNMACFTTCGVDSS